MTYYAFALLITPPRRSYMIVAVCLSFVCNSMGKITHVDGCRPNMVVTGKDDPLELIKFWCLSRSECGSRISFFFTFLNVRWTLYTIYCHSPDGDAVALSAGLVGRPSALQLIRLFIVAQ